MAESSSCSLDSDNTDLMKRCYNDPHITSQFEILEKLGEGGYGTVLKVRLKTDKKIYALKLIPVEKGEKNKMLKEAEHLSILQHKNVVRYYTSWMMGSTCNPEGEDSFVEEKDFEKEKKEEESDDESIVFGDETSISETKRTDETKINDFDDIEKDCSDSSNLSASLSKLTISGDLSYSEGDPEGDVTTDEILCIKMEYCERTLREYIKEEASRTVDEIDKILSNIVYGLMYIHEKGIIHRDIKPDNIFLDYDNCVKIGDFGLSCQFSNNHEAESDSEDVENRTRPVGTPLYRAPEIRTKLSAGYGKDVDWYSVGIILFEICYIFSTGSHRCVVLRKLNENLTLDLPEDFDTHAIGVDHFKQKIMTLLDRNPKNRLSAVQTLSQNREVIWYEAAGFCSICKIDLPTYEVVNDHMVSIEHKENKAEWLKTNKGHGQLHHWCAVCQIPCNRLESLTTHVQGKQHASKIKGQKDYFCKICEKYATGSRNYDQHLASKSHKKEMELKKSGFANKKFTCDICNIECSSPQNLKQHNEGEKHRKKEKKQNDENENKFSCEVCEIKCTSSENYKAHRDGKNHKKQSKRVELSRKLDFSNNVDPDDTST